jgi:signal transduction histidine kinase
MTPEFKGFNKNLRKKFLLEPQLQSAFGFFCAGLAIIYSGIVFWLLHSKFDQYLVAGIQEADLKGEILEMLSQRKVWLWSRLSILGFFFSGLMVTASIIYTHRMVGPVVAFSRHVKELAQGNYASRVKLRKGDAFQTFADELNALAEGLQSMKAKKVS